MSDMAEDFRIMRERVKEHREKMLAKADTTGWTEHTPYHFSRATLSGERVDWWPSGGKAKYQGKMVYGHRKVQRLFARLFEEKIKEQS